MIIAASGMVISCAATSFAQTVDERIGRALAAINKDDFAAASTDLNEIFKADPKNATALYLRGMMEFKQAKYDDALADQTKAIELNPNPTFPQFYYERGITYQYRTNPDYKLALADFSKAIQIAHTYKNAYEKRAWTNFSLQNWAAAESDYTQAIKLGSNTLAVYANRAAVNLNLKNYDQSIADSRKALEIDPTNATVKENFEKALKLQVKTSHSDTDGLSVAELLKRADDAKSSGDAVNQEKYLTAAIKLDPKNFNAYEQRVFVYNSAGKIDAALADCQQLINLDPSNFDGYFIRANIYKDIRDFAHAISDYTSLLGLKLTDNQSPKIYYLRGVAYEKNFQYDEAVNDFTKVISLNSNYTDPYFDRSFIYQGLGNYDLAEADLKKILKIKSGDKSALGRLDEIKELKKMGYNTDHSFGDSPLRLVQYMENVTEMEKTYFEKLSLATTKVTQTPTASAEICSLTVDANLVLKKIEINAAGINQIVESGKIDKLGDIKKDVMDVMKRYQGYRGGINKLAADHGCKLD